MLDIEYLINRARHEEAHRLIVEPGLPPVVQEGDRTIALPYPELDGLDTFCLARDLSHSTYQKLKANESVESEAFGCRYVCRPMEPSEPGSGADSERFARGVHIEVIINDLALSH